MFNNVPWLRDASFIWLVNEPVGNRLTFARWPFKLGKMQQDQAVKVKATIKGAKGSRKRRFVYGLCLSLCNQINRINAGNVLMNQPWTSDIMTSLYVTVLHFLKFSLNFYVGRCCAYLVRFRHKTHMIGFRKIFFFGLKKWFCCHKHDAFKRIYIRWAIVTDVRTQSRTVDTDLSFC